MMKLRPQIPSKAKYRLKDSIEVQGQANYNFVERLSSRPLQ